MTNWWISTLTWFLLDPFCLVSQGCSWWILLCVLSEDSNNILFLTKKGRSIFLFLLSLVQYITCLKKKMWLSKLIYTLLTLLYFWQQWDYTGASGGWSRLLPQVWCDPGKQRTTRNVFSDHLRVHVDTKHYTTYVIRSFL